MHESRLTDEPLTTHPPCPGAPMGRLDTSKKVAHLRFCTPPAPATARALARSHKLLVLLPEIASLSRARRPPCSLLPLRRSSARQFKQHFSLERAANISLPRRPPARRRRRRRRDSPRTPPFFSRQHFPEIRTARKIEEELLPSERHRRRDAAIGGEVSIKRTVARCRSVLLYSHFICSSKGLVQSCH